jgi:hypothetical protein
VARQRGKAGGPGVSTVWSEGSGEEIGGPECSRGQLRRPTSAPGRWAQATLARAADRRDRATTGPGGQRLGVGGSEREWGSAVRGADRRAWQHSAGPPGFIPN